jgi:PAS domain S-box-containing protein
MSQFNVELQPQVLMAITKHVNLLCTDIEGKIKFVNENFTKLLGISSEELVDKYFDKYYSEENNRSFERILKILKSGFICKDQFKILNSDNQKIWVELQIIPQFGKNEEVEAIAWIAHDIQMLKNENDWKLKSIQVNTMAKVAEELGHEMNNPLTVIQMNVKKLLVTLESEIYRTSDYDFIKDKLSTVLDSSFRIQKITKGLNHFSTISKGNHRCRIDLLTKDIIENESKNNPEIDFKIKNLSKVEVNFSEVDARKIISNLIQNSKEAIKKLNQKWIILDLYIDPVNHVLSVKCIDSGKGICETVKKQIMMPFVSTKKNELGIGLSLCASKMIARAYQGDLIYDCSTINTTFVLQLPLVS